MHNDVAGFVGFAHKMDNRLVGRNFKVHIYFHSSFVGVAGKSVPCTALCKFRHTHCKLTAFANVADNELVDGAFVNSFKRAEVALYAVLYTLGCGNAFNGLNDFYRGIRFVRRAGIYVEISGVFITLLGELNLLCAHSDIDTLFKAYIVLFAVKRDYARAADIDYAHFTAL